MTTALVLDVQLRDVLGKQVKRLRQQGLIPATVYGKGFDPVSVQVDDRTFQTVYRKAGRTSLIELNIPGKPRQSVFVQEVQRHPVGRHIIHADFRVVDLKVEINAEIPLTMVGTSPLISGGDAIINQSLATLAIHALPANVPQNIEVDISSLTSLDKAIYVRDLPTNPSYTVLTDSDELIVSLTQTRAGVEAVTDEEEASSSESEPELIRKDRQEDAG